MRSHPKFAMKALDLVEDLPAARGRRGVVAREAIKKGETLMNIPQACMLSTATAARTADLGSILADPRNEFSDMPTVVLTLHLMMENARCLEAPPVAPTADVPVPVAELVPLRSSAAGSHDHDHDHDADACTDDSHGHSHAHAHSHGGGGDDGGHGHSHGGASGGGHGHSHGGASGGGHGHSHGGGSGGGGGGHGHSHGGGSGGGGGHGHSHGGKPCHGHGHGGDGGPEHDPIPRRPLDTTSHPWGSPFRAYLATLPPRPTSCLTFTAAQVKELSGM